MANKQWEGEGMGVMTPISFERDSVGGAGDVETLRADSTRGETMVIGKGRPRHPKVGLGGEMEGDVRWGAQCLTCYCRTRAWNGGQGRMMATRGGNRDEVKMAPTTASHDGRESQGKNEDDGGDGAP